jgi:hypothetical protein
MMRLRCGKALLSCLALAACAEERRYIGEGGLYQVALAADTAPALEGEDGEGALYIVERRIELPVRQPPETTLQDLQESADNFEGLPFPRMPFVERDDLPVQVDFTLSNLDDDERQIAVIVNGYNEFDEYVPGAMVVDDELVIDLSQWERIYELGPKERISFTIREEEFDEAAVDLATVVNGAPNPQQVVYFENKSVSDTRSREYIPAVIPGLMGFRIGLRSLGAARVVLDASVRVRDVGDRLADDNDALFEVEPEPFMPSAAMGAEE